MGSQRERKVMVKVNMFSSDAQQVSWIEVGIMKEYLGNTMPRHSARWVPICFLLWSWSELLLTHWCCPHPTTSCLAEQGCTLALPWLWSKGGAVLFIAARMGLHMKEKGSGQHILHWCLSGGKEGRRWGEGKWDLQTCTTMQQLHLSAQSLRFDLFSS